MKSSSVRHAQKQSGITKPAPAKPKLTVVPKTAKSSDKFADVWSDYKVANAAHLGTVLPLFAGGRKIQDKAMVEYASFLKREESAWTGLKNFILDRASHFEISKFAILLVQLDEQNRNYICKESGKVPAGKAIRFLANRHSQALLTVAVAIERIREQHD